MIYFDNAATGGRKPDSVLTAVRSAIVLNANPGRSGHTLSIARAQRVYECRKTLSAFFDGYGFERVVFTKNCSEALNLALLGVLESGDHVVTTCMEHNSILRPLEHLSKTRGVTYDVCPLRNGNIDVEELLSLVKENTRIVAVTSASNVTGISPPIEKIGNALPKNVLFLVDGAQGGGHFPISMQKGRIDMLCLAGHKGLYGIQGSGAFLFSTRVNPMPVLFGGTGTTSNLLSMPDFYPDALESGTLSYPAIVSLLEGVRYLSIRLDTIAKPLVAKTEFLCRALEKIDGYTLYSKPNPCGIVAFAHKSLPSEYLALTLSNRYGIAVRAGLHCAPLMHKALGTHEDGLVRVSFAPDNTEKEIRVLIKALKEINEQPFD